MSVFREDKSLSSDDQFTVVDSHIVRKLLETKKLTERQKLAVRRLLRTYWNSVD